MEKYNEAILNLSKVIILVSTDMKISKEQRDIYEVQLIDVENVIRNSEYLITSGGELKLLQLLSLISIVNEMIFVNNKPTSMIYRELQSYFDILKYIKKDDCKFQYNQLLLVILERVNKIKSDMDQEIYSTNKNGINDAANSLTKIILEKFVS